MRGRSIQTAASPLLATLQAAPSKSVTHRALVTAALAHGSSRIVGPLDADDTRVTLAGLAALGLPVVREDGCWQVTGRGGRPAGGGTVWLAESGTSFRLLTAVAALGSRVTRFDGAERLRQRPIDELLGVLQQLGADVRRDGSSSLPLQILRGNLAGGRVALDGSRSSQFASALLTIGPRLTGGLQLTVCGSAVSLPYVELTARVMESFGIRVERPGSRCWHVAEQDYAARSFRVEGDHSSASYPLAAAIVAGGTVRVSGLDPASVQPDACLGSLLRQLGREVRSGPDWIETRGDGRLPAFDLRLSHAPDLVPTMAILALFADGACALRGVAHLRLKESDRLELLAHNLRKLGRRAEVTGDALMVAAPRGALRGARIETRGDHRMAMAFAVAGLRIPGIEIDDAECVSKSNPEFWRQFALLEGATDP